MSDKYLIDMYPGLTPLTVDQVGLENWCNDQPQIRTFFRGWRIPIGIEIEAENVNNGIIKNLNPSFWTHTKDDSLKNNGMEFISRPLSGIGIDHALENFIKADSNFPVNFSIRCSIHVHVNVSHYTINNLNALMQIYALFENLFYEFVDPRRKANPFCYPITDTKPGTIQITNNPSHTTKYCGINIAPIEKQMTVEFRILEGTNDWTKLRRWIQIILKLVRYCKETQAKEIKQKILDLSKTRDYESLLRQIFGANAIVFSHMPIQKLCHQNLLWAQLHGDN